MSLLYIIEDEPILADCIRDEIAELAKGELEIVAYNNAISAIEDMNRELPDVILLDVLLGGPDGFTMLNELISYPDTARIPVVIMTSLKLQLTNLEHYGVVEILDKMKMTPEDIYNAVKRALEIGQRTEFQAQKPQPPQPHSSQPASASEAIVPQLRTSKAVESQLQPVEEAKSQPQPALEKSSVPPSNINPGAGLAELNQKLSLANKTEPHAE